MILVFSGIFSDLYWIYFIGVFRRFFETFGTFYIFFRDFLKILGARNFSLGLWICSRIFVIFPGFWHFLPFPGDFPGFRHFFRLFVDIRIFYRIFGAFLGFYRIFCRFIWDFQNFSGFFQNFQFFLRIFSGILIYHFVNFGILFVEKQMFNYEIAILSAFGQYTTFQCISFSITKFNFINLPCCNAFYAEI